jgi:hypothetical protein
MTAVIERKIEQIVKEWETQIRYQNSRPIKQNYPTDIAMIARNVREFPHTKTVQLEGAFPIFYKDQPEDVIKKYCNVFAEEAYSFMKQIENEKTMLVHENGMSVDGNFRVAFQIPENLNAILKNWSVRVLKRPFPSEWWMKKIREVMPACFIGNMKTIKEKP